MATQTEPLSTERSRLLSALAEPRRYDLAVIGGGASGLGVALDASLRGLSVVLLESCDFAKGTSSRATKLVHGGVRYLAQGNVSLVREALRERTVLLRIAPHLARPLPFVMPCYHYWEMPFYGTGLKLYDVLAGKAGLGNTEVLGVGGTERCLPGVRAQGLKGGVKYWDGQFDDARLALALARTAAAQGALLVNYCAVTDLVHEQGRVAGLHAQDAESGAEFQIAARCVVNATGVWVDEIRGKDARALHRGIKPVVEPSQGVHLVVDRDFLRGDHALLVPKTRDGRVLFAVPWLGKVVLGTTDTLRHDLSREPDAFPGEIDFILGEAGNYLTRRPTREDVRSVWVGLRPLVRPSGGEENSTKKISREHTVLVSPSGLVTVTGGKWTTYRAMAADVLDRCVEAGLLPSLPACATDTHVLLGAAAGAIYRATLTETPGIEMYGEEARCLRRLDGYDAVLADGLTEAMVRFAARYEYARSVEDVLARRYRLLFLDARLAAHTAPRVADLLREELGVDPRLDDFLRLAEHYLRLPAA
ncbi:MAG: glycerol-3-phosphate dehydrogenase/oxidase [Candidimonas sp.]|nr:MAG: glycerol-3-phosphate dehydrogenase/oxidase [Candidimonas sp.]